MKSIAEFDVNEENNTVSLYERMGVGNEPDRTRVRSNSLFISPSSRTGLAAFEDSASTWIRAHEALINY